MVSKLDRVEPMPLYPSIYGLRSKSLQLRPALATPSSLHHCKVRDEGMFNKLASCVLLQKEVCVLGTRKGQVHVQ